jgi:hypothetical protein
MAKLVTLVEEYLADYNSVSSKPMKLVLFLDAIEHVSRICRWVGRRSMPTGQEARPRGSQHTRQ